MPGKKSTGLGSFMSRNAPAPDDTPSKKGRTKGGKVQLLVYLQPEGVRQLKLAAVEGDTTASAIVAEALNEWLQKHGRPPVA